MAWRGIRAHLIVRDRGMKAWRKRHEKLMRDPHVRVGVFASDAARADGEVTNVELAAIHEFGSSDGVVPERSFLRSTMRVKRGDWKTVMRGFMRAVVRGAMTAGRMLDLMGLRMVADTKKRITSGDGIPPPLQPATIARKGSSRPLVDTGTLVNAITHVVVEP
jgi:hypothetical protein